MLTIEEVKKFSELYLRIPDLEPRIAVACKLRLCYLKDNTVCRLGYVKDISVPISPEEAYDLDDTATKSLAPEADWESFTNFINNAENLNTDMLIADSHAFLKTHKTYELGTYTLLKNGVVEEVDVQANVGIIVGMAKDACKAFI